MAKLHYPLRRAFTPWMSANEVSQSEGATIISRLCGGPHVHAAPGLILKRRPANTGVYIVVYRCGVPGYIAIYCTYIAYIAQFRVGYCSWSDNVPISYILLILHQYHTIRGAYCFTFLFLDFLLDRHYTYYTHLAYIAHIASYRFISLPYRYHIYNTWYVVTCPHIAGVQRSGIWRRSK